MFVQQNLIVIIFRRPRRRSFSDSSVPAALAQYVEETSVATAVATIAAATALATDASLNSLPDRINVKGCLALLNVVSHMFCLFDF